jgi:hypothetical protein
LYVIKFATGLYHVVEAGDQDKFLYFKVCPLLEAYGLATRRKEKNPGPGQNDLISSVFTGSFSMQLAKR